MKKCIVSDYAIKYAKKYLKQTIADPKSCKNYDKINAFILKETVFK